MITTKKNKTSKVNDKLKFTTDELITKLDKYYNKNKNKDSFYAGKLDDNRNFYMVKHSLPKKYKLFSYLQVKNRKKHGPWIWIDRYVDKVDGEKKASNTAKYLNGYWMHDDFMQKISNNNITKICLI